MKKILSNVSVFLGAALWGLQNFPTDWDNIVAKNIRNYSGEIGFGLFAAIALANIILYFIKKKDKRKRIERFFDNLTTEHLGSQDHSTRITLFKERHGLFLYLRNIRKWKNHKPSIFKKYLAVYVRKSYPNEGTQSLTFFKKNKSNDTRYSGVVDKCFREGTAVAVSTEHISDIELADTFEGNTKDKRRIKAYMEATHIDMLNYTTLYNMSRKANEIYAVPITTEDELIWGVLVIDRISNGQDESQKLKKQLDDKIEYYIRIFKKDLFLD